MRLANLEITFNHKKICTPYEEACPPPPYKYPDQLIAFVNQYPTVFKC